MKNYRRFRRARAAMTTLLLVSGLAMSTAGAAEPVAGWVNGTQEVLHTMKLGDGNIVRRLKFSLTVVTDDTSNPLHLASQDCFATYVFTDGGDPVTGKGFCDGISVAGDLWWLSIELMPDGSVRWQNQGGTGRFAELTASGTTRNVAQFEDGKAIARFEGTYTLD